MEPPLLVEINSREGVLVEDDDPNRWREKREDNPECFLYGGTCVVRIRWSYTQDGMEKPAIALVKWSEHASI